MVRYLTTEIRWESTLHPVSLPFSFFRVPQETMSITMYPPVIKWPKRRKNCLLVISFVMLHWGPYWGTADIQLESREVKQRNSFQFILNPLLSFVDDQPALLFRTKLWITYIFQAFTLTHVSQSATGSSIDFHLHIKLEDAILFRSNHFWFTYVPVFRQDLITILLSHRDT